MRALGRGFSHGRATVLLVLCTPKQQASKSSIPVRSMYRNYNWNAGGKARPHHLRKKEILTGDLRREEHPAGAAG